MINDVLETVKSDSGTIFLDVSKKEYNDIYKNVNKSSAQDFANIYFEMKQKEGIPQVVDISENEDSDSLRFTVKVDNNRDFKLEEYKLPHIFENNNYE